MMFCIDIGQSNAFIPTSANYIPFRAFRCVLENKLPGVVFHAFKCVEIIPPAKVDKKLNKQVEGPSFIWRAFINSPLKQKLPI